MNEMFQKIYSDASDETKRAMNKSFQAMKLSKLYLDKTFLQFYPFQISLCLILTSMMIFDDRRVVELCCRPTGVTLARKRLKSNPRMAWSGRNMIKPSC